MKNKYGLGNIITEYKNRKINMNKPVLIYRNLNNKTNLYSIKQNNLVVGHTNCIMLRDAEFIIRKSGQRQVRETKQKNVHAFIKGIITKQGGMGTTAEDCIKRNEDLPAIIKYNPYKDNGFMCVNLTMKKFVVNKAWVAILTNRGCSASYLDI